MRGWQRNLLCFLIVVPAFFAYRSSFDGVFVFDDRPSIVDNPYVRNAAPWVHPWKAMQAPRNITVSGRPVASFTFAMNYALAPAASRNVFDPPAPGSLASSLPFRQNAWGYHATNLAIHLISTLLLFGVARRTTGSTFAAACAAILWSVHPLTTGAVTYIVQRVESLMAMFALLTLYCSIRAWELPETPGLKSRPTQRPQTPGLKSRPTNGSVGRNFSSGIHVGRNFSSGVWALFAIIACAFGMGSKEAMVGVPLIVLAWDWTFSKRSFHDIIAQRWPLYAGLAGTWMLLGALVAMDARPLSSGFHFPEWPWTTYFLTQCGVILEYLRLVFWPAPLILDRDVRQVTGFAQAALPFALLTAVFALGVFGLIRRKAWGFSILAVFILLAPTSSVLPIITEIAAEHRMYLPLAVIVASLINGRIGVLGTQHSGMRARAILAAITVVLGVPLMFATIERNAVYASDAGIWFDTVQKQPKNARARNNYASNLLKSGQSKAAEEHLRVAVARSPRFAEAHANLAVALATEGRVAEAIPHFERALEINPFYTDAYENLAEAYGSQNQLAKAVKYFLKALDQRPDDVALLNKTAWILATAADPGARDGAEAIVLAEHAVTLTNRSDASSLDTLAAAYAEAGRFEDAIAAGTEALALARARGDQSFPLELEQRLALYRSHKPIRM